MAGQGNGSHQWALDLLGQVVSVQCNLALQLPISSRVGHSFMSSHGSNARVAIPGGSLANWSAPILFAQGGKCTGWCIISESQDNRMATASKSVKANVPSVELPRGQFVCISDVCSSLALFHDQPPRFMSSRGWCAATGMGFPLGIRLSTSISNSSSSREAGIKCDLFVAHISMMDRQDVIRGGSGPPSPPTSQASTTNPQAAEHEGAVRNEVRGIDLMLKRLLTVGLSVQLTEFISSFIKGSSLRTCDSA